MSCTATRRMSILLLAATVLVGAVTSDRALAKGKNRTVSAALKHPTPLWEPISVLDGLHKGYPVGSRPAAWCIVLAYWKQHQGKTKLLRTTPQLKMNRKDPKIWDDMNSINSYIAVGNYGEYKGRKYHRTAPHEMTRIKDWIEFKTVTPRFIATVERLRGSEYGKFHKVKASLERDRPVILLISDPAKPGSLQYVVIEKAELTQEHVLGKWRDRDVSYYVNMVDGRTRKKIWVREYRRNEHPRTGSFSMFLLNIQ